MIIGEVIFMQKSKLIFTVLALFSLGIVGSALLTNQPSVHASEGDKKADGKKSLHDNMEEMGSYFKKVRKGVADPAKNKATLEALAVVQAHSIDAKDERPHIVSHAGPGQRKDLVKAYRKSMIEMNIELLKLELLILDGKNEEAVAKTKEIGKLIKKGHNKFQDDH